VPAISEIFNLNIVCDYHNGYTYSIPELEEGRQEELRQWLLDTFAVSNMLEEYKDIRDKIVMERVPVDDRYLALFLDAIRERKRVSMVYHRFRDATALPEVEIEPYCVRYFQMRWYAVVRFVGQDVPKIIAFDRIVSARQSDTAFAYPKDFDAAAFFAFDYGVGVGFKEQPEEIVLRVAAAQRPYMDALPLHPSQTELEHHPDYSLYRLVMKPSHDLARAILLYGQHIRVEAPVRFRELVREMAFSVWTNNGKLLNINTMTNNEIEQEALRIVNQLPDDASNPIDKTRGIVPPYFGGDDLSNVKLIIVGQDPTVDIESTRNHIKTTLMLDGKNNLRTYIEKICVLLGINIDKEVYATNLFKYYYTQKPAREILSQHAKPNVDLLKEELTSLPNCPILTLGEAVLQLLTSDEEKVKTYWDENHVKFIEIDGLNQKVYPFIHYNTWSTQPFYKDRFEQQLKSITQG
jgi:predicted DNA-binding transcriptional regulator YafY